MAVAAAQPDADSVKLARDEEAFEYNPGEHRKLTHPTNNLETLVHLMKGSLGSGILAMPLAFAHAGLWFGLISTFIIGGICTYCVHILVKSSQILCRRTRVPSLRYADIAETAFLAGPKIMQRWSAYARFAIEVFLVVDLIGSCCVYNIFVAENIKDVLEAYAGNESNIRYYLLALLLPLILLNLIRNLKHLAPCSSVANICFFVGMIITMYYMLTDTAAVSERPSIAAIETLPLFFGTVIFAIENIGVVMSLENNMKTPQNFIGCPGVLNTGMAFVVTLYAVIGFLGYLKYGDNTEDNLTKNLPNNEGLAQTVKLLIAVAIFLTYALQFYVPMEIIWKNVQHKFSDDRRNTASWVIRYALVTLTVVVAVAVPQLGPLISLIGAVCLSTLGLIFPSIIELVTCYEQPGWGQFNWILWKNILLISFGVLGFCTGTYFSIEEIIITYS